MKKRNTKENKLAEKANIVYKTTNLINGKCYIGVHRTFFLEDGYIGNGIKLQSDAIRINKRNNILFAKAVVKYGYENFKREILFSFNTYEEALAKEKELVNKDFIKSNNNYNVREGGFSNGDFKRSCSTKVQLSRTKTNFIIIDPSGREFLSNIEAAIANGITKDEAITRSYDRVLGWWRKKKTKGYVINNSKENMDNNISYSQAYIKRRNIKNAENRSAFITIDPSGREFNSNYEAALLNNVSSSVISSRVKAKSLGWHRIPKNRKCINTPEQRKINIKISKKNEHDKLIERSRLSSKFIRIDPYGREFLSRLEAVEFYNMDKQTRYKLKVGTLKGWSRRLK